METGSERNGGDGLPASYLRLLAPPLQLFSAAMWQVAQRGLVDHYGLLEEFVTMVTELVPELMSYRQRAQLVMGLRARLVLDLCRGEQPAHLQTIQSHLDRIKAPVSTAKDPYVMINQVEESEVNFVELVHTLLEDPAEREHFFQEIYPVHFGSRYEAALEMLVWEFITRLEELLPVPDFTQMVAWLGETPTLLEACLQSFSPPEDMKAVLEHHRNLGHVQEKDPRLLPMDDCILSSLSLSPADRRLAPPSSPSRPTDAPPPRPGKEEESDVPIHRERRGLRSKVGLKREQDADGAFPATPDVDLSTSAEAAGGGGSGGGGPRGGRAARKRKLSGGSEKASGLPVETSLFLDSSVELENSGDSPLISIWGEYTDLREPAGPVISDTKVPWSDEETLCLLDIWGKDSVQRVLKGCLKNRHIFTMISQKMVARGYMRTVEQCQTRIKRLKKCFRQCVQHNSTRGNARLECKFYEELERVLGSEGPPEVPEVPEVTYQLDETLLDGDAEDCQLLGQEDVGTRSVVWTDLETLGLINIWGEDRMQQDLRGMHRNGHIFAVISNKMAALGFSRTAEQCQTRIKRLKASFRQCYDNNTKGQEQVECRFYEQLEQILLKELPSFTVCVESSLDSEEQDPNPTEEQLSCYAPQDLESNVGVQAERKKVPWNDSETLILLEIWGDQQVQQNLRRCPHNGHIYSEVSEKLSSSGYCRSSEQCHTRIKRLKASYRQCQESMSSSGSDRVDFKFYDLMEQILEKQPSTSSSTLLTESIEISEDSNAESVNSAEGETDTPCERTTPGTWSDSETLALMDVWGEEDVQRALRGFVHNGHVYADISEKIHDLGFSKTPDQCRWKVKSLRSNFRQCYDRKKCGTNKVEYKFYAQLEGILGQEAASMDEYDDRDEQTDQDADADGTKHSPWSEPETLALIELWALGDVQHSLRTSLRNGHVFQEISDKLASAGHLRSAEQCHSRIKRLRKTYQQACSGQGNGGQALVFRYQRLLDAVLGSDSPYADVTDMELSGAPVPPLLEDEEPDMYGQASSSHLLSESSRKMPWSDRETRVLLEVWGEDSVQVTLRGCLKNRHVFHYISQRMNARGFIRTTEQCHTRIKRLKAGFLHDKEEFKFFHQMDEIFSRELKADSSEELVMQEPEEQPEEQAASPWVSDGSKYPWSDAETDVLLDIWGSEDIQENLRGCTKNRHIFSQISQAMAGQGFLRTADQCQSRVKRLKANFRHASNGKSRDKQECKFYDRLSQIFGLSADGHEDSIHVTEPAGCPSP